MKKIISFFILMIVAGFVWAQTSSSDTAITVKVTKDPRLDLLVKVQADYNGFSMRFTKGYRLLVLKSNNRDYSMKVRAYLLQHFPEEKVMMTYQSPFIKLKFGDFVDKKDAEKYRDMIIKGGVVKDNIYIVPETIELKPDKLKELGLL